MDLIIAILMAMGFISSPDMYNDEYIKTQQEEIDKAIYIIDNDYYQERDGGYIIDIGATG